MTYEAYDKFEYMIPNFSCKSLNSIVNELNKLGSEGWEVISFEKSDKELNLYDILLKRKITQYEIK